MIDINDIETIIRKKYNSQNNITEIKQDYINELTELTTKKTYMTTRNDIDKLLTHSTPDNLIIHSDDIDNPKAKLWRYVLKNEKLDNRKIEHHLVINPKIENIDEQLLFSIFKDLCAKFYRKYLGKHFNKMKDQQIMIYMVAEYGKLYNLSHIKETHFHIILKSDNEDMLNQFHIFMEKNMRYKTSENMEYYYKIIDTPEYRVNVYNYLSKENRIVWTNNELYKKKESF